MFSIFKKSKQTSKLERIQKSISRFPFSYAYSIIFAMMLFCILHGNEFVQSALQNFAPICVIGFFLSLGISIMREYHKISVTILYQLQLGIAILCVLLGFSLGEFDTQGYMIRYLSLVFGSFAALASLPFLPHMYQSHSYVKFYNYLYSICLSLGLSALLGLIFFGLSSLALGSIDLLFGISFGGEAYGDLAIVSFVILAPFFGLSRVPFEEDLSVEPPYKNKFFRFLACYIGLGFIVAYMVILYIYTLKLGITFGNWPKGEISWLIIVFSLFGYLIYIFGKGFESSFRPIALFRKYFPFLLLPQIAILFYAIGIRIGSYDLTINRYLIVLYGVVLLCATLYFIFSKKKELQHILLVLAGVSFAFSFGPHSIVELPYQRQIARFEDNLQDANILIHGAIVSPKSYDDVPKESSKEIYAGIKYLCDFHSCNYIKKRFPEVIEELNTEKDLHYIAMKGKRAEPSTWQIIEAVAEKIKVKQYHDAHSQRYIHISLPRGASHFPLNIKDKGDLFKLGTKYEFAENKNGIFYYDHDAQIMTNGEIVIQAGNYFDSILATKLHDITQEKLNFTIEEDNTAYTIYVESISAEKKNDDSEYSISSIFGFIYISPAN